MTGSSPATLLALVLAGAAALLALPPRGPAGRRIRLHPGARAGPGPLLVQGRSLLRVLLPVALAAPLVLHSGVRAAVAAVAVLTGWGLLRLSLKARRAEQAARRRERVVDFGESLLGELRSGQPVLRCLERGASAGPEAEAVAAAARLGADVPSVLRRVATRPGGEGLAALAAAWQLCAALGSGLAVAVERVVEGVRAEQATTRLVEAEVASAKATARLVAALPVLVLLVAQGVGADPWHFLLGTGPGVVCLGAGCALLLVGLEWIDRVAEAARSGAL